MAQQVSRGGTGIGEVLRRAWSRLARKQWLILYPLAVAVVDALAFLAVYSADGDRLSWTQFFAANVDRWQYVRDHFFSGFAFTSTLGIAVAAGFAACLGMALIRAPYFRAIAGPQYPLAPRRWGEVLNLLLYYLFCNLITWVVFLPAPTGGVGAILLQAISVVIIILVAFADYVIVYEELGFVAALRRSVRLLQRRWLPVVIVFVVFDLITLTCSRLYGHYYNGQGTVFILLPVSQVLLQAFLTLLLDLFLIFLYEDIRRQSPA